MEITGSSDGMWSVDPSSMEVPVKVLARFPDCQETKKLTTSVERSFSPGSNRPSIQHRKESRRPVVHRRKRSVFPTRSVTILALIAAGIWGFALRNEWLESSTVADGMESSKQRQPHWVAHEPRSRIQDQGVRSE